MVGLTSAREQLYHGDEARRYHGSRAVCSRVEEGINEPGGAP